MHRAWLRHAGTGEEQPPTHRRGEAAAVQPLVSFGSPSCTDDHTVPFLRASKTGEGVTKRGEVCGLDERILV